MTEDRLRELLRDPGWSLPAWPDAEARVRRAARRQRMALARLTAAATAVITMTAVVPVMLLSRGPAEGFVLPPVGMAGFTASVYPAPVRARVVTNLLRVCPSPAGLQALGRDAASKSLALLRQWRPAAASPVIKQRAAAATPLAARALTQRLVTSYLRLSDRAYWPQLASGSGIAVLVQAAAMPVLWSGPLGSYHPGTGPPSPAGVVAAGCGSRLVGYTWMIISGHRASPARAAETFFLKRSGHVLLYNATSRPA